MIILYLTKLIGMVIDMSIKNRINRWKQLHDPNPDKKTIVFLINHPEYNNEIPILCAANKQKRIDWAKRHYEWQINNTENYEDDSLPCLYPMTGTEIFAEAFGCDVIYPDNSLPFARPLIFDSKEVNKLKVPKLEDTPLMMLFDIVDELKRFAGNDTLVRLPDIQCPIDISALIWDKNDFFPSMIDTPEAIHELSDKVMELMIVFLDEWFKKYGTSYVAHFPDYYMDGGITMSTDEIGCVSPEMYRELFAGELNVLSRRYGGIGIHCCADSKNQLENLKKIEGLKVLNLHRDWNLLHKVYDMFQDVCAQMHYTSDKDNITSSRNLTIEEIDNELPEICRLIVPLGAQSVDHAKELADLYGKYR